MGKRILAVDDDPDTLLVVKTALKGDGHEVETAENGKKALEAAIANPPDLIVMDILMPEMNGAQAAGELKNNPITAKIPIIMLTALKDKKYIKAALTNYGVDFYIIKPFEIPDFLTKVDQALAHEV